LAEKRKGGNVVTTVWDIAAPIAEQLGLILWDVKFVKEGVNWYLRITIDKEGGVGIDDCVSMNDALDAPLEEADPIEQSYNLQVQSPGIERELVRDFHFIRYIGSPAVIRLRVGLDGAKTWKCVIKGYNEGIVSLEFPDGSIHDFSKQDYSSIKLDDFNENF